MREGSFPRPSSSIDALKAGGKLNCLPGDVPLSRLVKVGHLGSVHVSMMLEQVEG